MKNFAKIAPLSLIFLSFLIAISVYPRLPYPSVSHWDIYGQPDGFMLPFWAAFFMPLLSFGLYVLFLGLPYLEPYRKNFLEFENYYDRFMFVVFGFLFYLYLLTIYWNLGYSFNMVQLMTPGFSILYYYIGILCQKSKMNWFVGIRTPWTLSNQVVWKKTHQLGAQLFKITAAISLLTLIFPALALYFIFIPVILTTITLYVYSWWQYRQI